jgi:hypothetical protein
MWLSMLTAYPLGVALHRPVGCLASGDVGIRREDTRGFAVPTSGQDVHDGPSLFVKGDLPVVGAESREQDASMPAATPRLRHPLPSLVGLSALIAVVVLRIATVGSRLPATPLEARLVDAVFPLARLSGSVPPEGLGEWMVRAQLGTYAAATGAFGRHADVLGGARELAVALCAVLLVAVVVVLRELRTPLVATAIALALLVVCEPAITALATLAPGLAGVAWTAVGVALVLRPGPTARLLGAVAALVGVATAPLLAVPLMVVVAAATVRRWAPAALVALSFGASVLVVEVLSLPVDRSVAPVALVVAALLVAARAAREIVRRTAHRPLPSRLGVLVGAVAVLAVAVVPTVAPVVARPSPHLALAGWLLSETDPAATVSVPDGVRSDLVRDGVPAARLVPDGALVVSSGEPAAGTVLARFGTLGVATSVPGASESVTRALAGEQLARNPNLDAAPAVLAAVRAGNVDTRLLVVLAGLAGRGRVVVTDLPAVIGEDPSTPRHRMELAGVDASTTEWLRAQQPPFAPVLSGLTGSPSLNWPLPAPTALLGR